MAVSVLTLANLSSAAWIEGRDEKLLVALGVLIGLVNGLSITRPGIPELIVTLAR